MPQCVECDKIPSYNYKGLPYRYCYHHKKEDMIDVRNKLCEKCNTRGRYKYDNSIYCRKHYIQENPDICKKCINPIYKNNYCNSHYYENELKAIYKICENEQCNLRAKNIDGIYKYCKNHQKRKICKYKRCKLYGKYCNGHDSQKCILCSKTASYNYKGMPYQYCKNHKESDMVDVRNKKCEICDIRARYKLNNKKYCKKHYILLNAGNKCKYENCIIFPSYNYRGLQSLYCKQHRLDGMIDVKNRTCAKCNRRVKKDVKYCIEHIDSDKYCLEKNCCIIAKYNFRGKTIGKYCQKHKKPKMILLRNTI